MSLAPPPPSSLHALDRRARSARYHFDRPFQGHGFVPVGGQGDGRGHGHLGEGVGAAPGNSRSVPGAERRPAAAVFETGSFGYPGPNRSPALPRSGCSPPVEAGGVRAEEPRFGALGRTPRPPRRLGALPQGAPASVLRLIARVARGPAYAWSYSGCPIPFLSKPSTFLSILAVHEGHLYHAPPLSARALAPLPSRLSNPARASLA